MNFESLKAMVDTLVKTYKCPECNAQVNGDNVDIIGAAGSTVNIDIECFECGKHSMIKSEILSINLDSKNFTKGSIDDIKKQLTNIKNNKRLKENSIKDEEIIDLNKNLKKEKLDVSDLFGDIK